MLRACTDVVSKDHSEPSLDSGFAMRVVAALPKAAPKGSSRLMTRRERRHRWVRLVAGGALPAAAAVLFFCVLIWPPAEPNVRPTFVLGASRGAVDASGVESVLNPALDAVTDMKRAARSLNQLLRISVDGAREDVQQGLEQVEKSGTEPAPGLPFLEVFLQPFDEMLYPVESEPAGTTGDQEIERF